MVIAHITCEHHRWYIVRTTYGRYNSESNRITEGIFRRIRLWEAPFHRRRGAGFDRQSNGEGREATDRLSATTSRRITSHQDLAERRQSWEPVYSTYPLCHRRAGQVISSSLAIDWICYCCPEGTRLNGASHCPKCGRLPRDSNHLPFTAPNRATRGRQGTEWRRFGKQAWILFIILYSIYEYDFAPVRSAPARCKRAGKMSQRSDLNGYHMCNT